MEQDDQAWKCEPSNQQSYEKRPGVPLAGAVITFTACSILYHGFLNLEADSGLESAARDISYVPYPSLPFMSYPCG